jgi:2-phosphosulfolactate phosphatase
MDEHIFDQHPHRVRLEWGRRGVRAAAERGDIIVIVDALSFTSAVATAVAHGIDIYPLSEEEDAAAFARLKQADLAVRRPDVPRLGTFSLSPQTFERDLRGSRVVVASPNGATCARIARDVPYVFAASLLNAEAVAGAVRGILDETERCATIVACGERWSDGGDDGGLRFAVEDHVAAGAVISYIGADCSPEARAARAAYEGAVGDLLGLLLDCASGRELIDRGYEADVRFCAKINAYDSVPELRSERFAAFGTAE